MEPYRPAVDLKVVSICQNEGAHKVLDLTPNIKAQLTGLLDVDLAVSKGEVSPLSFTMQRLAWSFAQSLEEGQIQLELPNSVLPAQRLL